MDENSAIRRILEGTATATGDRFFDALVINLAAALDTHGAWVTEYLPRTHQLRAIALWMGGKLTHDFTYDIAGTACETVIKSRDLIHLPDNVLGLYPNDEHARDLQAISYLGIPLMDAAGTILGHLSVLDRQPMPAQARQHAIFKIFAARAAAELQRLQVEKEIRASEDKYRRIVETAGEGFIFMDDSHRIVDVNASFCRLLGYERREILGRRPFDFGTEDFRQYCLSQKSVIMAADYRRVQGHLLSKDGREIPVLFHGNDLMASNGAHLGSVAFVTDMTEHHKSLKLAGEIQKSLMPQRAPAIPGLDIAGRSEPCDEIGGDYFDFIASEDGQRLLVAAGDLTGHGVDAALLMTTARAFLRMRALQPGDLAAVVADLNRHLTADTRQSHRFMTLLLMAVDPATATIEWVRAGHDPALLYDPAADAFEELRGPGLVLGLNEAVQYSAIRRTDVRPGQIIALGTDGIWEARNTHGEMWGKERLQDTIRARGGDSAGAIVDSVFDRLKAFTRGTLPEDDKTLVVVRFAA
jgi:sigma-B regulation protein RsbU (phosphoserine phosphatase)